MKWEILNIKKPKNTQEVIDLLLENRGINNAEEFFNPQDPSAIDPEVLGIDKKEIKKAEKRILKSVENGELVFIYGDYDADGICATAILWETLHKRGAKVLPFIPDRFEDGYGIKQESVARIIEKNPEVKLIITVDNGIVAFDGIKKCKEMGIDVLVLDHHTKSEKLPEALAIIHTTKLSGSGIAWLFSQRLAGGLDLKTLELAAIGTVADQLPLTGANRSIVKFGLYDLTNTLRPGLRELYDEAGLTVAGLLVKPISVYEIGFIIAPRINAMGRLKHAIDSLRLLCTKDRTKAREIAKHISQTNFERQRIVEEVILTARKNVGKEQIIVIAGESYHEGVIGLAAGKLAEEFYRPAIVLSTNGEISKASARSIAGFDIIEAIRNLKGLYLEGGGHPMAAGFSILTKNIPRFSEKINKYALNLLTGELMERKLKIDCEISFNLINYELFNNLKKFEPVGLGNPTPTFSVDAIEVVEAKKVGKTSSHLKLKLRHKGVLLDSIFFGGGELYPDLTPGQEVGAAFQIEENVWNSHTSLQLKIKDLKL